MILQFSIKRKQDRFWWGRFFLPSSCGMVIVFASRLDLDLTGGRPRDLRGYSTNDSAVTQTASRLGERQPRGLDPNRCHFRAPAKVSRMRLRPSS